MHLARILFALALVSLWACDPPSERAKARLSRVKDGADARKPTAKPAAKPKTLPTLASLKKELLGLTTQAVRTRLGAPDQIVPIPQRPGEVLWFYEQRVISDFSGKAKVVFVQGEVVDVQ